MNKYDELISNLKNQLQSLLNADNTEAITKAVSTLDDLTKEHQTVLDDNSNLKTKIVEIVKGTTFKEQSEERRVHEDRPLTFEEACSQAEKQILENRRN